MLLDDTMKLKRLSGCEFEIPTTVLVRNLVHRTPLRRRTNSTRKSHADHKRIRRFNTLSLPFVADVTVVLLVDAMKLGYLSVACRQCTSAGIGEAFCYRSSEI